MPQYSSGAIRPTQVTERDLPLLILVHGPPGSGKTTIAAALAGKLGLALFAKDEIKEELYESLGAEDPDACRRLGAAVYPLLFLIARRELLVGRSLVLEANFAAGEAEPAFATLPPHRLVQVYCAAPEDVTMERYLARDRHPGHHDRVRAEEVRTAVRSGGAVVTVAAPDQPPTTVTTGSNGRFSIGVGGNGPYSLDVQSGVNTQNVKWERVVLHLSRAGTGARFSLSKPDVFGDNLFADLRIGPDGKLYQLATSPSTGVVISRYSLGRSS
jgi:predicted kinase